MSLTLNWTIPYRACLHKNLPVAAAAAAAAAATAATAAAAAAASSSL